MFDQDPIEGNKDIEDESLVFNFQQKVREYFPQYSSLDREEFDNYDPIVDKPEHWASRGRWLHFFVGEKTVPEPVVLDVGFKMDGFVVNYFNSPEPANPYTIRAVGNSIFGPDERWWRLNEIEMALENARIQMEGINTEDESFKSQLAGWLPSEDRFVTMQERIDKKKELAKKGKPTEKEEWKKINTGIWNLFESKPDKAKQLVSARLGAEQINDAEIQKELNRIAAQESLLKNKRLI